MTELIWKGKYDSSRKRKAIEKTVLPFRVVETITESRADRENAQRDLFREQAQQSEWRNMLIWGDNKFVISSLLPRFAGGINLIYIDPPFATGRDFSFPVRVGDEQFLNQPFIVEQKAYRDVWGRGLDSYLRMMYERLTLMRELLADDGSIYVHLGHSVVHYLKAVMDELFAPDCYRNEIIWKRDVAGKGAKRTSSQWPRNADHILFYSKSPRRWFFRQQYGELSQKQKRVYRHREPDGRRFKTVQLGDYSEESIRRMERQGLIYVSSTGKKYKKYYLDEARDTVDCIWTDILGFGTRTAASEHLQFPTQKPEALLERILRTSSREGDLVGDFFCGSGTTGAVAEKLGRRWILCDLSKRAIHVSRKRFLRIEHARPFEILHLRNYERHKLVANGFAAPEQYRNLLLKLYRAESRPGRDFKTIHGKKAEASLHVGGLEGRITEPEIRRTLKEAKEADVPEVHFLGWEFEMGLRDIVGDLQDEYGVKLRLISIPKESLEVTNPAKEGVKFFGLNHLELGRKVEGRRLTVIIKDFTLANTEYLPEELRENIVSFADYIDYWAVDWDYPADRRDTFHNRWQSFRTRKNPGLETTATYTYHNPGDYIILVKIVDIFANETAKVLQLTLR